jgi:hypothetical protein
MSDDRDTCDGCHDRPSGVAGAAHVAAVPGSPHRLRVDYTDAPASARSAIAQGAGDGGGEDGQNVLAELRALAAKLAEAEREIALRDDAIGRLRSALDGFMRAQEDKRPKLVDPLHRAIRQGRR